MFRMSTLSLNRICHIGVWRRFGPGPLFSQSFRKFDSQSGILTGVHNVACSYSRVAHSYISCLHGQSQSTLFCKKGHAWFCVIHLRFKTKKPPRTSIGSDGSDSDESEDEDQDEAKDSKVLKGHVNSTRIDAVLKFGLGMSRNKVENAFYSNSIYLNGERLDKKKHSVAMEDEVDVVRGQNSLNPAFIDVQRVEVLDLHHSRTDPDKVAIRVRRFKRLTIDNYQRPWKPLASD